MNALKAISKTDDQLIVENHIVIFDGRDLEGTVNDRVNPDGSRGEFFTKATDLRSPYTNTGVLYVDWEHGIAPADEPGEHAILGFVDWTTAKSDDVGVMVRRILDRRNQFVRMLEPLIEEGLIGTSSEAIAGGVVKADDGSIQRWPLYRDTLTVTPMEPRMLSANALQAAKALADHMPALKSALAVMEAAPAEQAVIQDDDAEDMNQPEPVTASVEIQEQAKPEPVAQNVAPAAEPETEPEPDQTEQIARLLEGFLDNITEILGVNDNE